MDRSTSDHGIPLIPEYHKEEVAYSRGMLFAANFRDHGEACTSEDYIKTYLQLS